MHALCRDMWLAHGVPPTQTVRVGLPNMVVQNVVKKNEYRDSVMLMKASEALRSAQGVLNAALMMGTEANKGLLRNGGLLTEDGESAAANDLILAVQAADEQTLQQALRQAEELLASRGHSAGATAFRLLDSAIRAMPDANLAIISIPGKFAGREARQALEQGLHVFLFSDHVPLQEEIELKTLAQRRGLLVMGPGCGTAIINHVGLGFANVVRPGPIGIVAASGTGLQEVCVLIHRRGSGISQAIGVGGRDLSDDVGGMTTLQGLQALDADEETRVIVLLSKPPSPQTAEKVLRKATQCRKPVVVNFLGMESKQSRPHLVFTRTLEDAALQAVALLGDASHVLDEPTAIEGDLEQKVALEVTRFAPQQRYVRGLFSGGTLCYESMLVLRDDVGDVYSNAPLQPSLKLHDVGVSQAHTLIDMGTEDFTQGRAHPMIDPSLRQARILQEAGDPEVAVLLLDVVLGYGSHPDPAGALAGAISEARARVSKRGGNLSVVAEVCGTDQDPQNLALQEERLRQAGALVVPSNAQAARLAGALVRRIALQKGGVA